MLMEEALEYLDAPLRRVAMPDVPIPTGGRSRAIRHTE